MAIIASTYFLDGIMDVYAYSLRGMGKSTTAMVITLLGTCLFRMIWVYSLLEVIDEVYIIYWAYPISWFITSIGQATFYHITLNKLKKSVAQPVAVAAIAGGAVPETVCGAEDTAENITAEVSAAADAEPDNKPDDKTEKDR